MRLGASLLFACFIGTAVLADSVSDRHKAIFTGFAADISADNVDVVAHAVDLVSNPPNTLETIGIYGAIDAPAPSRSLRGIISKFGKDGHLVEMDPSFVLLDFEPLMRAHGAFAIEHDVPDLLDGVPKGEWTEKTKAQAGPAFAMSVSAFAEAAEAEFCANGVVVLKITLPSEDLPLFRITTPDVAERWSKS